VDGLKAVRRLPRNGERVVVNACDPLNLTGVVIRGPRTPAVRTNTITYVDGVPDGGDGVPGEADRVRDEVARA
jgi:ATP-dependent Lhr-like helicase